jgi:hypothetical protein
MLFGSPGSALWGPFSAHLAWSADGFGGLFSTTEKETTLRLDGGAPFIIKDIQLERASTFSADGGLIP